MNYKVFDFYKQGVYMICDDISNLNKYESINENIADIIKFLDSFDKSNFTTGRVDINNNLFVNIQTYETSTANERQYEVHEEYIDLQFIVSGEERIDYALNKEYKNPYEINKDGDYFLTKDIDSYSSLTMKEDYFAIFFPGEFHKPGCSLNDDSKVSKIVFKIKYE